jgi:hypothetical protein
LWVLWVLSRRTSVAAHHDTHHDAKAPFAPARNEGGYRKP